MEPEIAIAKLRNAIERRGFRFSNSLDRLSEVFLDDSGYGMGFVSLPDEARGVTDFESRETIVRDDISLDFQVRVMAHELCHIILHDSFASRSPIRLAADEIEAEHGAYLICDWLGLADIAYSINYIMGYENGILSFIGEEPDLERAEYAADEVIAEL